MLQPKRRKYRKEFRGRMKGVSKRGFTLSFGDYGIKALGRGNLTSNQIESARRTVTGSLKRKGIMWLRVFPDKPITQRGAGQRMGGGKGEVDHYAVVVRPGRILIEVAGVPKEWAFDALKKACAKLPFATKIISKE